MASGRLYEIQETSIFLLWGKYSMSDFKFCPDCGEKKVGAAAFCVACGHSLKGGASSAAPTSSKSAPAAVAPQAAINPAVYVGAALGLALIIYLIIHFVVLPKETEKSAKVAVAPAAASEHRHDDSPAMANLKEKAANGHVADLMDLAEAQIQEAARDGHYLSDAAETLERVLLSYPNHALSLRLLANINYDLRNGIKAVTYYKKYLQLHPEDANALTDMGTQLLAMDRPDEAIKAYKQALEYFPNFYNAYYNLFKAHEALGEETQASAYKQKAMDIEAEFGKRLAPTIDLPRLPEGASEPAPAPAPAPAVAEDLTSEGIDYMPVHAFFKVHPIIGPKLAGFRAKDGKGIMILKQFPMDGMPPMVRDQLEGKVKTMLQALDDNAILEVRDADTDRLMVTYTGEGEK